MHPTLCSKCKKNVAVIFITKIEGGETKNEGLCLKCAKELGIKPVDDMMKKMGISDDDLDSISGEMKMCIRDSSGGQKRRVAIAGVIAMEPSVLILDEPTAGLDPVGRDQILQNIRDYQKTYQATIVMVSHSMEEIAQTVDRLFVMDHSHKVMEGTPREMCIRDRPRRPRRGCCGGPAADPPGRAASPAAPGSRAPCGARCRAHAAPCA